LIQTSRILDLYQYDFDRVAPQCANSPTSFRTTCYKSLGRDAAGQTLRNPEKIKAICQKVTTTYRQDCYLGALNVIVDFWGENLNNQAIKYLKYWITIKRSAFNI
jgi:hypothetical protein